MWAINDDPPIPFPNALTKEPLHQPWNVCGAVPEAPVQRRDQEGIQESHCHRLALGPREAHRLSAPLLWRAAPGGHPPLGSATGKGMARRMACCVHTRTFQGPVRSHVDFRSQLQHCLLHLLGKTQTSMENEHVSSQFSMATSTQKGKGQALSSKLRDCG